MVSIKNQKFDYTKRNYNAVTQVKVFLSYCNIHIELFALL